MRRKHYWVLVTIVPLTLVGCKGCDLSKFINFNPPADSPTQYCQPSDAECISTAKSNYPDSPIFDINPPKEALQLGADQCTRNSSFVHSYNGFRPQLLNAINNYPLYTNCDNRLQLYELSLCNYGKLASLPFSTVITLHDYGHGNGLDLDVNVPALDACECTSQQLNFGYVQVEAYFTTDFGFTSTTQYLLPEPLSNGANTFLILSSNSPDCP